MFQLVYEEISCHVPAGDRALFILKFFSETKPVGDIAK